MSKWVKRFPHDNSCVCICVCVYGGKGWGGEGQRTLMRHTHNASFSQMGRSQALAYLLPLPPSSALFLTGSLCLVQVVWEGVGGGGRLGSPPSMFSLETDFCLFDFQWKQHQHFQFEQIVQCCPVEQRSSAQEKRTCRSGQWTTMAYG